MTRPTALVTGATGAIGPSVVAAMARTHEVRILSRRPPSPRSLPVSVTAVIGDVADVETGRRAVDGVDVVIHLAALLHIVDPAPALAVEYDRVNVKGTEVVVNAAAAAGVARVVVMSSIAVYGYGPISSRIDENTPARPDTVYGRTKLAAEQVALAARRADGTPLATVLRAAAVYGPRIKGNYERLVHALATRRFIPIGPGTNRRTVVFEKDLAAAAVLAATHPSAAGRVYNVSDGAPHALDDIIRAICKALGRNPPRWQVPVGVARAVARTASIVDSRFESMVNKYLEEAAIDATRIQSELGFRPATALEDGWALTIAEMRRTGRL